MKEQQWRKVMNKAAFLRFVDVAFENDIDYSVNRRYSDEFCVNVYMQEWAYKLITKGGGENS